MIHDGITYKMFYTNKFFNYVSDIFFISRKIKINIFVGFGRSKYY